MIKHLPGDLGEAFIKSNRRLLGHSRLVDIWRRYEIETYIIRAQHWFTANNKLRIHLVRSTKIFDQRSPRFTRVMPFSDIESAIFKGSFSKIVQRGGIIY